MSFNGDLPANAAPMAVSHSGDVYNIATESGGEFSGLTKREHFAAMAMQGICNNAGRNGHEFHNPDALAKEAVIIAEALLEELSK